MEFSSPFYMGENQQLFYFKTINCICCFLLNRKMERHACAEFTEIVTLCMHVLYRPAPVCSGTLI